MQNVQSALCLRRIAIQLVQCLKKVHISWNVAQHESERSALLIQFGVKSVATISFIFSF